MLEEIRLQWKQTALLEELALAVVDERTEQIRRALLGELVTDLKCNRRKQLKASTLLPRRRWVGRWDAA